MKRFWFAFYLANWFVVFYFWAANFNQTLLIEFGQLAGLVAANLVVTQFFLMSRLPWLEHYFGLDRLARFHQINGKIVIVFILLHPALLLYGYARQSGISFGQSLLGFLTGYEHGWLTLTGLILFVIVVVTSLAIIRLRLRYETWYFTHLAVYLAVFFSFWHQIELGTTVTSNRWFYVYWLALYLFVGLIYLTFRFLRPLYLLHRHRFIVARVTAESPGTSSVSIFGRKLEQFPIRAGQFMIVRFLTRKLWWQAHPFSLSQLPDGRELRLTIKAVGDYTKQIKNLQPGTRVLIDGPYGVFTSLFNLSPKVLMIAGGIGITPLRSLMEEMLQTGKDVVLLYGNRHQPEIVFKRELDELVNQHHTRVVHVISDEPNYSGERGRIDEEKLRRLVPDLAEREVYLCGPEPMMQALISTLRQLGLPRQRLHYEKFSF